MKKLPQTYSVWFQMDGWGVSEKKVTAIDVQDAINQVVAPLKEKFGDQQIYIVRVE